MRINFTHIALLTATMLGFSSASFAASPTAKATEGTAARLLKSVAADAHQIRNAASALEKLTGQSGATWAQYDRQWNEMQPAVESMNRTIAQLESMQASLSAAEKTALEQSKTEAAKIAWHCRELGNLIDKVPANLTAPAYKTASRELVKEAGEVAHSAGA